MKPDKVHSFSAEELAFLLSLQQQQVPTTQPPPSRLNRKQRRRIVAIYRKSVSST